jgi:hypothetical protein
MCGNIKKLRFADRHASDEELQKAALQYVRKISKHRNPTGANKQVFDEAVAAISKSARKMLDELVVK